MNHQETMTDYLMAFIEGLKIVGLNKQSLVQVPSTPLALLLHRETAIQTFVDVDERSAAFALGLSKASQNQWSYFVPLEQQLQTIIQQFVKPILAMCL